MKRPLVWSVSNTTHVKIEIPRLSLPSNQPWQSPTQIFRVASCYKPINGIISITLQIHSVFTAAQVSSASKRYKIAGWKSPIRSDLWVKQLTASGYFISFWGTLDFISCRNFYLFDRNVIFSTPWNCDSRVKIIQFWGA